MSGHRHLGDPSLTQNQGNVLGERPCVRQSRLYREHNGGNTMKELMGQGDLKWDTTCVQGAYAGGKIFDHKRGERSDGHACVDPQLRQNHPQQQKQQQQPQYYPGDGEESMEEGEETMDHLCKDFGGEHHGSYRACGAESQEEDDGVVIDMDDGAERQGSGSPCNGKERRQTGDATTAQVGPAGGRRIAMESQAVVEPICQPVAYRSFRPGAGLANRQTYNIFTGK